MKRKLHKIKVAARWEILRTVAAVNEKYGMDSKVDKSDSNFYKENFSGNYIDLLFEDRINPCQLWRVEILTKAKESDGTVHFHTLEFDLNSRMSLHDVLKGNSKVKLDNGGFKVKWRGVTAMWLDEVDRDLTDMTCIEAWVTASCVAEVKPKNIFNLMQKIVA